MNKLCSIILFVAFLRVVGGFSEIALASAEAWSCKATVTNGAITGGVISGRGCYDFSGCCSWMVWADTTTTAPKGYIFTKVIGYDRCKANGIWGAWIQQMTKSKTVSNTRYGTSDTALGGFQNCSQGHQYRVEGWHQRYNTTTKIWEGYSGNVYW